MLAKDIFKEAFGRPLPESVEIQIGEINEKHVIGRHNPTGDKIKVRKGLGYVRTLTTLLHELTHVVSVAETDVKNLMSYCLKNGTLDFKGVTVIEEAVAMTGAMSLISYVKDPELR